MASFDVLRPHIGDRPYAQGDTREADAASVKHLVRAGVLAVQAGDDTKKAKAPANKAAPKPANKAEKTGDNKAASQA